MSHTLTLPESGLLDTDTRNLSSLIASRICHDLISPVGAVANGLELMELSGAVSGEEMTLVSESAASANARIRFFRIAFGHTTGNEILNGDEIKSITDSVYADKIRIIWTTPEPVSRPIAQILLLSIMCMEHNLPIGGTVTIEHRAQSWQVTAVSDRLNPAAELWARLSGQAAPLNTVQPSAVQFLLLPALFRGANRPCSVEILPTCLKLQF